MKKQRQKKTFLFIALLFFAAFLQAQVDVNYKSYPDYTDVVRPDVALIPRMTRSVGRPERVNNAETEYFPPVIMQDGGSCGSASRIAYMFAYELNALRGVNGSLLQNRYPTHFTWLLTNSGSSKDAMAIANGVPSSLTYGGTTYSRLLGNQDCSDSDFGWMQGYNKWYAAMCNRLERTANFPLSVETEEGREAVKNWLWNHNGDDDYAAGGICGIGVASAGDWKHIPSTEKNVKNGVAGKFFVNSWGTQVDHALTIVGYDDRIEFDLDGNGVAGEEGKDETGAWIIVNSWGSGWCNDGFVYCPYKYAVTTGQNGSYYMPEVYYMRKNYTPLRTMKITMEYSKRSEIRLSAGISADLNADAPERTVQFEHFKYAGDGDGNGQDAEVPMLGRWVDGIHYEPMEFGYDLTDLSKNFDTRRPLKYFFIIESKYNANGSGIVHDCSVIDYEFDKAGVEFPFDIADEGVTVKNKGGKTIISVVVSGEPFHAPRNLVLADGLLSWETPLRSAYPLKGYNVYANGELLDNVGAEVCSIGVAGSKGVVEVTALYDCNGTEIESQRKSVSSFEFYGSSPAVNMVRRFTNSGFRLKDLFAEKMQAATIEFWLKPSTCENWNQQIGPGWEHGFLMHATSVGELVAGWNTGERITTGQWTLKVSEWCHVAVVVNGNSLTVYLNGEEAGYITSNNDGIGGFGSLDVGSASSNGINGYMDEFRVWNIARSQRDIQSMMYCEIADPANTPGLLTEVKMNVKDAVISDATGKYSIEQLGQAQTLSIDNALLSDSRTLKADFLVPDTLLYTGLAIDFVNKSSSNSVRFEWSVDGKIYATDGFTAIFDTPGKKNIVLTVYDVNGNSAQCEKSVDIESLPLPAPDFDVPASVVVGQRISFVNKTIPSGGCSFEWSMPGSENPLSTMVNTATAYSSAGEHQITLTAVNAAGSSSVTKKLLVVNDVPEAAFEQDAKVVLSGSVVLFTDISENTPSEWKWHASNGLNEYFSDEQNFSLKFDAPGKYDVTLEVANAAGNDAVTMKNALLVCNADAGSGLNFTSDEEETVTFANPLDWHSAKAFTIEWWMYSKRNTTFSQSIGSDTDSFILLTMSNGSLVFCMGGEMYYSKSGLVPEGIWCHLAVVFDKGQVFIYRDCELLETINTQFTGDLPEMSQNFVLGGYYGALNAVIDELRVWQTALDVETLHKYANSPIGNVAEAEEKYRLSLYCNFNQTSGDVRDATSNANHGVRSGFGPEGDAWSNSFGVFCLNDASYTSVWENADDNANAVHIVPVDNGVELYTASATNVSIYSVTGIQLYNEKVDGCVKVDLPKGIYIIGKKKIVLR